MELEVWSDIACPWCYVGKRKVEAALAAFDHRDEVTLTWRSFELDPDAPAQVEDMTGTLARKYGRTREEAEAMQAQMAATAAQDGLDFRFDLLRGGTTFDAHRLLHHAAAEGRQDAMKERLQRAYLTEGELMSDGATLIRLAREVGLDVDAVAETLMTGRYAEEVRDDEATARALGVTAVPFFVLDRRLGAAGAQPAETLLAFLQEGWSTLSRGEHVA